MSGRDDVIRPDLFGPALAGATGDERWRDLRGELLSGGKSNLTFVLTSPAGSAILRRPPTGALLPKAHDMGREVRVQRALAGTPVPVPRILLADEGALLGVPCYVMDKVEGHVIRDTLPVGYATTNAERLALAEGLVDTMAALHRIDPGSVGLGDHGRPEGFAQRQVALWTRQWERARTDDVEEMTVLGEALAARIPPEGDVSIVHGDFRMDNTVLHLDDPGRVQAVLDWEMSTLGDPVADFASFVTFWREPGDPPMVLLPDVTARGGFPSRATVIDRYAAVSGRSLEHLSWHLGLAYFKFGAIAGGIAARVRAGAMAGQDFGDVDQEVVVSATQGLAALDRY